MTYNSDRTIQDLDQGAALTASDQLVLWQNGQTVKASLAAIATYIAQGVPNPPSLPAICLAYRTSNYAPGGSPVEIPWQASSGALASAWNVANPSRLTVPATYNFCRITGNVRMKDGTYAGGAGLRLLQNGSAPTGQFFQDLPNSTSGGGAYALNVISPILPAAPGDYFELRYAYSTGSFNPIFGNTSTWLQAEFWQ